MSHSEKVATPEVSFSLSGDRLTLRDEAGGREVVVELDGDTSLTRATTSWFNVPMDAAVSFETERIKIPHNTAVWFRGVDGTSYGGLTEEPSTADGGTFVDIAAAMKIVAYVEEGPVRGYLRRDPGSDAAFVEFDEATRVVLGTRSVHEEPTATITVPDDPEALMRVVSHLGSSIKEWSAERSWPTLRGHPPAIQLGEELEIPHHLSTPDTGVTVVVPDTTADVLRVAPLAHYFGAEVITGDRPELRLDAGYSEPLGTGRELEQSVDELLARGLVLDSLVRIGGYFSTHRREYEELAPELPFYPPELYDESVDRQLLEYLEVPMELLEPYVPRWPALSMLRPSTSEAEALPHLLNVLSRVRVAEDTQRLTDSNGDSRVQFSTASTVPTGVASLPAAARRASLAYNPRPPEQATVSVLGGEPLTESCFEETNWSNHEVDGEIPSPAYAPSVTRAELAATFETDPLYLHFAGEVTSEGFVCTDGVLSFGSIPSATIGALSLHWPHAETEALVELLDEVAVVCLSEQLVSPTVVDALGKYLVLGFSPSESARFVGVRETTRYLGDASLSLTEHANGTLPNVFDVEPTDDGGYTASFCCRISWPDELGSVVIPDPEKTRDIHSLTGAKTPVGASLSAADLADIAAGDHLLRFHGDVPEEVPMESVIHTSRPDWPYGNDVPAPEQEHPSSRR